MTFRIETPVFNGTLAELVDCIQRDVIDVLDISLTDITKEFVAYLAEPVSLLIIDMVDVHFCTSQLLLLKAQYLLGHKEDDGEAIQLKEEVVDILIEFQRLKKLSDQLCELQLTDMRQLVRGDKLKSIVWQRNQSDFGQSRLPMTAVTSVARDPQELSNSLHEVAAKMTIMRSMPQYSQFPLALMRNRMLEQLEESELTLSDLIMRDTDRQAQLISALLVVLIAVQKQAILARQELPFTTVYLRKKRS